MSFLYGLIFVLVVILAVIVIFFCIQFYNYKRGEFTLTRNGESK